MNSMITRARRPRMTTGQTKYTRLPEGAKSDLRNDLIPGQPVLAPSPALDSGPVRVRAGADAADRIARVRVHRCRSRRVDRPLVSGFLDAVGVRHADGIDSRYRIRDRAVAAGRAGDRCAGQIRPHTRRGV